MAVETFFPLGLLPLGLLVLDAFVSFCRVRRSQRRIRLCRTFATLIDIVTESEIVSFNTLPVGFPIANNLHEFLVHAVLSLDS